MAVNSVENAHKARKWTEREMGSEVCVRLLLLAIANNFGAITTQMWPLGK
jgi:hypothetical protein